MGLVDTQQMDSTLYISHPTLNVAYTDVYCVSSDEHLSAMMSKRWDRVKTMEGKL